MSKKFILIFALLVIALAWGLKSSDPGPLPILNSINRVTEGNLATEASHSGVRPDPSTDLQKVEVQLNEEDQKKLSIFHEIIKTKNDNDPRMDQDLLVLSPELKQALFKEYAATAPEKRNDRGTIVFLVGRNIKDQKDVQFLSSVLMEKPCLSLQDCSKPESPPSGEEEHLEGINETTANYPQLNALRAQIERYDELTREPGSNQELKSALLASITEATHSPNPKIQSMAEQALRLLKP